jgi:hypothetical protein
MRELLFWLLLCSTVCGQFEYAQEKPANLGQAIGQGAVDAYALRKQVDALQEEVRRLTGENESLRAQLRATKQPEPTPMPVATFYSWTGCESCPSIIDDLTPFLAAGGWQVEVEKSDIPADGVIYPWLKLCWANKCVAIKSKRGERMTRAWLTEKMTAVLK